MSDLRLANDYTGLAFRHPLSDRLNRLSTTVGSWVLDAYPVVWLGNEGETEYASDRDEDQGKKHDEVFEAWAFPCPCPGHYLS